MVFVRKGWASDCVRYPTRSDHRYWRKVKQSVNEHSQGSHGTPRTVQILKIVSSCEETGHDRTYTEKGPRPQRNEDAIARRARDLATFERAILARLGLRKEGTALCIMRRHAASERMKRGDDGDFHLRLGQAIGAGCRITNSAGGYATKRVSN